MLFEDKVYILFLFFFFKQKTAYEIYQCDWSSDVCSSDLISTTHIHLDESNCLEFIAVKGEGKAIQALADRLQSLRGVKHGEIAATSTGKRIV